MDLSPANRKKELWLRHSQATCPRKQLTFYCTTTVSLRNDIWEMSTDILYWWCITIQILVVRTSDWLCHVGYLLQPINSTTQTRVVTCHQYGISALISQLRNVGCFLWLPNNISQRLQSGSWMLKGSIAWFQIEKGWVWVGLLWDKQHKTHIVRKSTLRLWKIWSLVRSGQYWTRYSHLKIYKRYISKALCFT